MSKGKNIILVIFDSLRKDCIGVYGRPPWGEVKRVWVDPAARGLRLASRLMAGIESHARALGFDRLRLDTNSALPEALALYRGLGWSEIPRFNESEGHGPKRAHPVEDYFDDLSRHLVYEIYKRDFELFRYDFENPGNPLPTGEIDLEEVHKKLGA